MTGVQTCALPIFPAMLYFSHGHHHCSREPEAFHGRALPWHVLQVTDQCDPLSLSINVTPYGDGTMGSWGNEACFDPAYQAFTGTVAGGNVNTSPISTTTDTTCVSYTRVYSVVATPGSTYDWSISGGGVLNENGGNNCQVFWSGPPGTYVVSVQETTIDGCVGPIVDTTIVTVEPILNLGLPYSVCPGTIVNLFANPYDGIWSGYNIEAGQFNSDTPGLVLS